MKPWTTELRHVRLALALALLFAPSIAVAGQGAVAGQDPDTLPPQFRINPSPDFFLGRPKASIGVRGGLTFAHAGSDWYDFVTSELTLDKRDFRTVNIAGEVVVMLPIPVDLVLAGDYGGTTQTSEFRYWVDNERLPIEQTTRIRQSTLTVGLRYALLGRGQQLGTLAWVPRRFAPYVGGGFGGLLSSVRQHGDFVDFRSLAVFSNTLESTGWTTLWYANGGVDVHMTGHLYVTADARYLWASKALQQPWFAFEPLDLDGLRLSSGINLLF